MCPILHNLYYVTLNCHFHLCLLIGYVIVLKKLVNHNSDYKNRNTTNKLQIIKFQWQKNVQFKALEK